MCINKLNIPIYILILWFGQMLHNGLVYLSVVGIEEMKIVKRNDFDAPASVSAGHKATIEDKRC